MFALIVAIDQYKSKTIQNLSGCVNDGEAMVTFLRDMFPKPHITRLYNEQATRENIINTFHSMFKENKKIKPGDAMLLFYAGHGSCVRAPENWPPEYRYIQTICPYDEETKCSNRKYIHGIPDFTINNLLVELAKVKGNNITLILDSCHAGGILRTKGTNRSKPTEGHIPAELDSDLFPTRGPQPTVSPEGPFKAMGSAVLLAACQYDEGARELEIDGKCRGAFTHSLVTLLRNSDFRQFTYSSLLYHLKKLPQQYPRCEGKHHYRFLFSNSDPTIDNTFDVSKNDSIYRVEAGSLHGVAQNRTLFAIYEGDNKCGDLVALEVFPEYCTAKLTSGHDPVNPLLARVVVWDWDNDALRLKVHLLEPALGFLQASPALDKYVLTVEQHCGELAVVGRSGSGKLEIERLDALTSTHADKKLLEIEPSRLEEALIAAANFNFRLYHPTHGHLKEQDVDLELRLLKELPRTMDTSSLTGRYPRRVYVPDTARKNVFEGTRKAKVIAMKDEFYGITLRNMSEFDLFPYVFYFDPHDYSITLWHHPLLSETGPLRRKGSSSSDFAIGYGPSNAQSIRFSLNDTRASETGFLKVFVSTKYVNLQCFKQAPFKVRGPTMVSTLPEQPDDALWHSWVYILTTAKDKSIH